MKIADKKDNIVDISSILKLTQLSIEKEKEFYPGFSDRLNAFIDLTSVNIPPMNKGRQTALAELFDVSKVVCADWLKKDRVPKVQTLRTMVATFLSYIDGDYNELRVEAWLKYGDEAIPNPFVQVDEYQQHLLPIAASLVVQVVKRVNLSINEIDLDHAIKKTIEILKRFEIVDEHQIGDLHLESIADMIQQECKAWL